MKNKRVVIIPDTQKPYTPDYRAKRRIIMKRRLRREGIMIAWDIAEVALAKIYELVVERNNYRRGNRL